MLAFLEALDSLDLFAQLTPLRKECLEFSFDLGEALGCLSRFFTLFEELGIDEFGGEISLFLFQLSDVSLNPFELCLERLQLSSFGFAGLGFEASLLLAIGAGRRGGRSAGSL